MEDEVKDKKEKSEVSRPDYQDEILAIIHSTTDQKELQEKLEGFHAYDISQVFEDLDHSERIRLIEALEPSELAEVFEYLESDELGEYLKLLKLDRMVAVLNLMEPDKVAAMIRPLSQEQKNLLFLQLSPGLSSAINKIQSYDEEEIGSRMTTNYLHIPRGLTVKQAMRQVIRQARVNDNINNIYVLDHDGTYYGAISLKDLIVARTNDNLDDIISTSFPFLYADEDIDQVVEELKDYNEDSIPILNRKRMMEGVITAQDLLEVMDEEMGEDYAMLAGLTSEEDLNEPLTQSLKKRLPWLLSLLVLGLGVSTVVSLFEAVVAALTIVMVFQSLILDMSGNVGTQSLAVTIRILLDDTLNTKDQIRFIFKEAKVGFSNGVIIGFIAWLFLGGYIHWFKGYNLGDSLAISSCVAGALILAMTISAITGTAIPIILTRFKKDPAVASGPLITTVNDLVGIVIYYGLCWIFLINFLHL